MHRRSTRWCIYVSEPGHIQMVAVFILRRRFAVDDEGAFDLFDIHAARKIINHLVPIAMTTKALNLSNMRFNLMVKTEDGNPLP